MSNPTRIKELRIARGATQQEIANLLQITRGAFANIENGLREPDLSALHILAGYFNVSIDFLTYHDRCQTDAFSNLPKSPAPSRELWEKNIAEDYQNARDDNERRFIILLNGYDDNHYQEAKRLFPDAFPDESRERRSELLVYFERLNVVGQKLAIANIKALADIDEYKKQTSERDNGTLGRLG